MTRDFVNLAAILGLASSPALADDYADVFLAREISQVISGADLCGYSLDDAAVARFAGNDLPKMSDLARMSFQSAGGAMEIKLGGMSSTKRIATCAMLRGIASKYELLRRQ